MSAQTNVANYLRQLADKVEKSSWCYMSCNDSAGYVSVEQGKVCVKYPNGERKVTIELDYIEGNT
jgi:hypothetical protein